MSKENDLTCHHCGFDGMLPTVRKIAQGLIDRGFKISSGYRCAVYNADPAVGGVSGSQHVAGRAFDVLKPIHASNTVALLETLIATKPGMIIIYPWGLHVDYRIS